MLQLTAILPRHITSQWSPDHLDDHLHGLTAFVVISGVNKGIEKAAVF